MLLTTFFVGSKETLPSTPTTAGGELLIVPSYLQHPPFPYYEINIEEALRVPHTHSSHGTSHSQLATQGDQDSVLARKMESLEILGSREGDDMNVCETETVNLCGMEGKEQKLNHGDMQSSNHGNKLPNMEIQGLNYQYGLASSSTPPLLVKVRVVGSGECDFVEVEVPSATYPALLKACCEELEVQTSDVVKIRKLPNVWVRKDRDVQRMKEGQELEVVLKVEGGGGTHLTSMLTVNPFSSGTALPILNLQSIRSDTDNGLMAALANEVPPDIHSNGLHQ